ncbi:hypothetical protein F8388_005343 [Cannabis sativa]|uniref:non-specific serine/threonine protein kinase n=1 Tax=Cannabis sativa TaxID=3483 RepID=A0A7J6ELG9_CANSA|nr:hypothetical protein F8388_005343 [Cannabis sativa]
MLLCWTNAANITLGSSLTAKLNNHNEESSWLSPNGDFSFGFQQIQKDGFLLAIWFNKIPEKTIVWSANRDNLVQQGSIVELTKLGSLSLRDSTGKEVWSTGFGVDHAAMLNTGNFVLANKDFSNNWESFNEPTDTLLPTQVLTTTKQLIASYSKSNYSRGRYLMKIDDGDLVLFSRRPPKDHESIYWPENLIDGRSTGQGISFQVMFNKSGSIYVQARNETVLKWLSQSNSSSSTSGLYQRAILEYDGVFRHYVYPKDDDTLNSTAWPLRKWSQTSQAIPENKCLNFRSPVGSGACGYNSYCSIDNDGRPSCYCPNGYTFIDSNDKMKGCVPIFEAQSCNEDLEDYKNFYIDSIDFLNWPYGDYENFQSVSEDWCRNACLVDCFCPLAIFAGNKCYKIAAPLTNGMMDSSIQGTKSLVKIRKGNSTASKQCNNLDSKRKVDKTTLIVIGSVIVSSSAVLNILLLITSLVFCFRLRRKASITKPIQKNIPEMNLQNFSFFELEKATNGFKEQLGAGAFGVVFKGVVELVNNNITSIIAVKKLYNNNMVKEGEQEFKAEVMSIGSTNHKNLVKLIGFCNEGQHRLLVYEYMSNGSLASFLFGPSKPSWHQRKQLALGIARGLFYLHEEKNVEANVEDDAQIILGDWACDCYESGKVECLVENDDEAKMEMKMVEKYVMVALWCIQEDPSLRPTMKKVMLMLEGSENVSAPPLLNSVIIYSNGTRHCDGLILLINHELGTMLLCNPTLKESTILPEPNYLKTCFNKDKNEIRQKSPYVEFGHDSKSNDYKCVAIWCGESMCKAEVYTMGSDSWRKIKMCQDITDGELSSGFCWKGVCYWMVDRTGNGFTSILSFNMSNEEFHFIHLPDFEYWTINKYDVKFSVWNDSIVLFVKSAKERILRIFKMDVSEAGSCSWTEYVHANPVKCFYNEAPFWKNDEILMQLWNENSNGNGTIKIGATLTAGDKVFSWLSPSGEFALGFHQLPHNKDLFLLAIWFNKLRGKTVVWYADTPNNPTPKGSKLELTADRGLLLTGPRNQELWKSGTIVSQADMAIFNDTGNFVLFDRKSKKIWESFNHPTDTLLSTKVLEKGVVVSSSISPTNFSKGRFQLSLKTNGKFGLYTMNLPSEHLNSNYYTKETTNTVERFEFVRRRIEENQENKEQTLENTLEVFSKFLFLLTQFSIQENKLKHSLSDDAKQDPIHLKILPKISSLQDIMSINFPRADSKANT